MELVEADLLDDDSIMEAIDGSTFVAHTASAISPGMSAEKTI